MATMTIQQLRDYEAKLEARLYDRMRRDLVPPAEITSVKELAKKTLAVRDESDLHNQIIDYCKSKGWQYLHGSMAERTHRTLGEPDFIILAHGSQLRMVECKSKPGKLSLDQQGFIAHAAKNGHVVYVVRSMEEFTKLFV